MLERNARALYVLLVLGSPLLNPSLGFAQDTATAQSNSDKSVTMTPDRGGGGGGGGHPGGGGGGHPGGGPGGGHPGGGPGGGHPGGGPGGGHPGGGPGGGHPGGGPGGGHPGGGPGGGHPGGGPGGGHPGGGPGGGHPGGGPGGGHPGDGPGGGHPGGGPGNGGHPGAPPTGWKDHTGDVSGARQKDAGELAKYRDAVDAHRGQWDNGKKFPAIDNHHGDDAYWQTRLDDWYASCPRPAYFTVPNWAWPVPMPPYGMWDYAQVEMVAENMEYLAQDIYDTMTSPSVPYPNPEYQQKLIGVMLSTVEAAQDYDLAVRESVDWNGSIDDLFFLDDELATLEDTLNGFSHAYLVQNDVDLFQYYVNELLWQYRQNY